VASSYGIKKAQRVLSEFAVETSSNDGSVRIYSQDLHLPLPLRMLKTHRPHHRACPRHYVSHFLNLPPIAQRVRHRLAFGDTADAVLRPPDSPVVFTVESVDCRMLP
jgi:hypothetical protein